MGDGKLSTPLSASDMFLAKFVCLGGYGLVVRVWVLGFLVYFAGLVVGGGIQGSK